MSEREGRVSHNAAAHTVISARMVFLEGVQSRMLGSLGGALGGLGRLDMRGVVGYVVRLLNLWIEMKDGNSKKKEKKKRERVHTWTHYK